MEILSKLFLYGCIGVLIEFFFTGIYSLLKGNLKATAVSYLWMLPIYGVAGLFLEQVSTALLWSSWLKAFLYVPIIYGIEALSGWLLFLLIGSIPWEYQKSKWSPMGLINLKYSPFWLVVAICFDTISLFLKRVVHFITIGI